MKKKIKLLFDTQQLETFSTNKETGLFRFASEVFKRLLQSDYIDLYCYIDKNHQNVIKYLEIHYPTYEDKLVFLPNLSKTARDRNIFIRLKSLFYRIKLSKKYQQKIKGFDWYFSAFNPISPIIYKTLKSSIFVHDLIPIICPDITCQKFTKSYKKFIENIKSDLVFFNSNNTKKDFLKYRPDYSTKNTEILHLAANHIFKPINNPKLTESIKRKYQIKTKEFFLSVSDLNPRKNILFTIKNFITFLNQSHKDDISLVLVGSNKRWNHSVLKNIENFEKYQNKIIFTGFIDDQELPILYSAALSFIYPSLYEGFGLPPLEAMQSGTVVITSNNSSIPEVVGNSGILIDPRKDEDLLYNMHIIYDDDILRGNLVKKSLIRAKLFSWDILANKLIARLINFGP